MNRLFSQLKLIALSSLLLCGIKTYAQVSSTIPGSTCDITGTNLGNGSFMLTYSRPLDFFVDGYGNSYSAGYRMGPNILGQPTFEFQITKYDSAGIFQWQKDQFANSYSNSDDYRSTFITSVVADESKNVYIGGCFSSEKLVLDTIVKTFPNNTQRGFIAKMDSTGTFVWIITTGTAGNHIGITSLEISGNRLYAANSKGTVLTLPDNTTANCYGPGVCVLTTSGDFLQHFSFSYNAVNMNAAEFNAHQSTSQLWTNVPVSPRIQLSSSGHIMVVGRHDGLGVRVGTDTLYDTNQVGKITTFCAVLDTSSGWINAYTVCYTDRTYSQNVYRRINLMPVFTVDAADNLYYADNWEVTNMATGEFDTVFLADNSPLIGARPSSSVLMSYDVNGQLLWKSMHSDMSWASLEIYTSGVYGYATYSDTLLFTDADQSDSLMIPSYNGPANLALMSIDLSGNLLWGHAFGGVNHDMAYHLRKSPCSDDFICMGLQSSASVLFNQTQTVTVPQADRIHLIRHSPDGACIDSACWVIPPPVSVGSEYVLINPKLYPNPCDGQVSIEGIADGNYSIEISDAAGKLHCAARQTISGTVTVTTSELDPGMYFIRIYSDSQSYVSRLVVGQ